MADFTVSSNIDTLLKSSDNSAARSNLGLGTAATTASTAYATAAQGTTADSAQQPPSEGAFVDGDKTKLDNAVESDDVEDIVSLTQAAYDALTPVATTFYIITG